MIEITLLDKNYAVYGDAIKVFESLAYSDAWEKHGSFALVVDPAEFKNIAGAAWLRFDSRVYENEIHTSEDEESTVKITGSALSVLFDRVIIKEAERLQGRLEERIRYLVNKYAITGSQAISQLVLETDNDYKRAMDATTTRGQTLSDFLYTALPQRGFSFRLTLDIATGEIVFELLQSVDRTQSQTVNIPVMLSTQDAIEKASYKKSVKDFRNFAIVCDEDDTAPQTVEVDLSNGEPIRAMYVSGRSAGADDSEATNMYVMVGQYSSGVGFIASSTDGVTFTSRVTSGYGSFWGVDYQNGMFIVCGDGGAILTSTDAITWTPQTSGVAVALEGALYYDGMYLVTGNSSNILKSYNKTTWTLQNSGFAKIVSPIWSGSKFISFGALGYYYASDDYAETWTPTLFDITDGGFSSQGCVSTGSKLIVAGYIGRSGVYTPAVIISSDEFATYTVVELNALTGCVFYDIAYGNGVAVAIGQPNMIMWSDDGGETWTDCTPAGGTPNYITVCFNETDGTFHAYSYTGKYHAYSSDGKSWALSTFTASVAGVDAVVYGTSSHSGNLYQIGVDALQEAAIVETLDGDVNSDLAPVYETDYQLGDILDAVDPTREITAEKRVLEVEHLIDKDTDLSIIPKLGKDYLSLRKFISKEIKNNGI